LEYKDILEWMDRETEEDLIEERHRHHKGGHQLNEGVFFDDNDATAYEDDALPVIHSEAALKGVGIAKLLLNLQEEEGGQMGI
jgi:hypothetical protein